MMFLTVPNDFSNWKKIAQIDLSDEFDGIKFSLPAKYKLKFNTTQREEYEEDEQETEINVNNDIIYQNIDTIWDENNNNQKNFVSNLHTLHHSLTKLTETWSKLTVLVERFEKRKMAMSLDEKRFESILNEFIKKDSQIFQMDKLVDINQQSQLYNFETEETQNLGIINNLVSKVSTYFSNKQIREKEEIIGLNSSHLENFKKFLDYLNSFNSMLERLILYKVTTEKSNALIISKLVKANEKLQLWLRKPDIKGSDFDKLNNFILLQNSELNKNLFKIILIKNCVKFEYKLFSKLKYLMSEIFQDWFSDKVKYSGIYADLLDKCYNELQELPLR